MAKDSSAKFQRLDKCVAHLTGYSRQESTRLIKEGSVSVDDEVIVNPGTKISIYSILIVAGFNDDMEEEDMMTASEAFERRVFMLNKPFDFVCADRDKNHRIVASLFSQERSKEDLHCAGRLDLDTTGLLIVTDDGDLIHDITSPKKAVNKLYYARLNKAVPASAIAKFKAGLKHPEEKYRYLPAVLTILPIVEEDGEEAFRACVQITEGKYHEVKRLFELVGCEVLELSRLAIGALALKSKLNLGDYIRLAPEELALISCDHLYTTEEMLSLVETHENNMLHSPLTFVPERWRNILVNADGEHGVSFSEEDEAFLAEATDDLEADNMDADACSFDDDELDEDGNVRIY